MSNTNESASSQQPKYVLRFSHNIIEHLGLKLYQNKPTNVIAELVSNSWDADANNIWINLITNTDGSPKSIIVADDGRGMDQTALVQKYLVVGKAKRAKGNPNETSIDGRMLMGRKGIGKLAPFGVAQIVELITVQNNKATWLKFDYQKMTAADHEGASLAEYEPEVIADNKEIASLLSEASLAEIIKPLLNNIAGTGRGTIIWAHHLTLRRPISPSAMLESLGRRFTVTLARPDFKVKVNDTEVTEKHVFPEWEIRIPDSGSLKATVETPIGNKEISYWVGFVKEATWSHDQAGVGIYAHGKIAQDRPFFFGNKGNEIFTRYLYAVVEADWIDELENDAISTDRTSIDWDNDDFTKLHEWGSLNIRGWIQVYTAHRKAVAKTENIEIVTQVLKKNENLGLRESEKDHLADLLAEVTPRLGKEEANKEKLVEATVKAWVHEPARKLIKKLWEEAAEFDADKFSIIVGKLSEQLIPESLSLAVVFSQRVYALTQLHNHIMLGKETQLQALIEQFPWILKNDYEKYIPRNSLKTICDEAEASGIFPRRTTHPLDGAATQPDFVFFEDANQNNMVIVELKGPEITASYGQDEQLNSYVRYLQSRFPGSNVNGILVSGNFDEVLYKTASVAVEYVRWEDVLKRSRRDHMELLAALLAGSETDKQDARVQQICQLGGKPVEEFLIAMSQHTPQLALIMDKLSPQK
ncbi:ATP-binding protein [Methyloradius palustris]|uniref:ATP-binding protein n=1 Tax=Methyloradius palustris TaxID=2778876 RepID=A0A8D5FYN4_9PROT|nr:ATP-binding protein [Methyloradius palustris]BCM24155.1 hypothetical protein ZMTM_04140 [Methyloradius palustris]